MRRSPSLALASCLAAATLAAPVLGCGSSSTSYPTQTSIVVTYELSASGTVVFDSLHYDDGTGLTVRVGAPWSGWSEVKGVAPGGSLEAHVWGTAQGGAVAMLKVSWFQSGVSSHVDSSRVSFSALSHFTLSLGRRTL